jgi:hypothetical protein
MTAADHWPDLQVRATNVAVVLGGVALAALTLPHVAGSDSLSVAAKVGASALSVVVFPGSLVVLAASGRMGLGLLEILALGVPVSMCLVQVATIGSLGLHLSSDITSKIWIIAVIIGTLVAGWRTRSVRIPLSIDEMGVGALIFVQGALLYLKGSPLGNAEDWSHVAIVRRLAFLGAPAIDNFFFSPGIVYPHPLPGTHYAMALVSKLSGLDPLFVYHKMRFVWSISAVLVLYAFARRLFQDGRVASATTIAAILLTLSGVFADVPGVGWAQLATYSHPSDVALGVLLPGLLALSACYLMASNVRETAFALIAALSMAVTLTMAHIRETIQFLVYLGSFAVALAVFGRDQRVLRRTVLLAVVTLVIVEAYMAFHRATVTGIAALDDTGKAELLAWLRQASLRDLFKRPLPISVGRVDSLLHGWMPGILLLSPLLWLVHRRQVLLWLPAASIVAYILLIRFPVLSFVYAYLTYWEILLTPGRNVAVFVHVFAGLALLAISAYLSRIRRAWPAVVATTVAGSGVAVVIRGLGPRMSGHQDLLFLGVLGGYAVASVFVWRRRDGLLARANGPNEEVCPRPWLYALLVLVAAAVSFMPEASPLNMNPVDKRPEMRLSITMRLTPRRLIGGLGCLASQPESPERVNRETEAIERISCPPTLPLVEWAARTLPPNAVLAADTFNAYPLPAFLPQQVAAWPVAASQYIVNAPGWYPAYYERLDRTMRRYGIQPFFNSVESWAERVDFLRALGVTHIVVDPPYRLLMTRTLGRWPEAFTMVYDDSSWTVYEVGFLGEGRTKR